MRKPTVTKCELVFWVIGWALAIYLPALGIALLGLYGPAAGSGSGLAFLPSAVLIIADDMSPWAKLTLGALLLLAAGATLKLPEDMSELRPVTAMIGWMVAILIAVAFLPAEWSRGFGVGIAGKRFDPLLLVCYMAGSGAAGILAWFAYARCRRFRLPHAPASD